MFEKKPTKTNNNAAKPMEKPTTPKKTTFSKLWSLCHPSPSRTAKLVLKMNVSHISAPVRETWGLFAERGGSYIRTSVRETGGLFMEQMVSYIRAQGALT